MVSPGTLRTLTELADGDHDAFEPSVDETGEVSFPTVERTLDERDGDSFDFLERMADRGVLQSSFEHKLYSCPDCARKGMQFTTACPRCGAVHATEGVVAVHPRCGTTLERERASDSEADPESTEDSVCPGCDEPVTVDDLESERRYRCHDCDARFDEPAHRLWCRECQRVVPPDDAREEPVYRYPLTPSGERWIAEQVEGRRLLAETFAERGYGTSVDTTVSTPSGDDVPVHLVATDDLFDHRVVAGVHESPTLADAERLLEAARGAGARPMLLLTEGAVDERVADVIDEADVTVVSAADGTLSSEFVVTERDHRPRPVVEWLDSLLPSSTFGR